MEVHASAALLSLGSAGKGAPTRIQLLSCGDIGWAGFKHTLKLTAKIAARIIKRFQAHGTELPIDYEHASTAVMRGKATKAPAAGWVKSLEYVDGDGLYAQVTWNDTARGEIEREEYKYWSPVIAHTTKEILGLHSVALTNKPRTIGAGALLDAASEWQKTIGAELMAKINKRADGKVSAVNLLAHAADDIPDFPAVSEDQMALAKLLSALNADGAGLAEDSTITEIVNAAITKIGGSVEDENAGDEETTSDDAAEAAEDEEEDEAKMSAEQTLTAANVKALSKRVDDLTKDLKGERDNREKIAAASLVDEQIECGKLLPDDEVAIAAANEMAQTDPEKFKAIYAGMPAVVEPGKTVSAGAAPSKDVRSKQISQACQDYAGSLKGASIRHYVDAALYEDGQAMLSVAEIKTIEEGVAA